MVSKGLKIDGMTEGRPAEKAGILAGDILLKVGDKAINDVYGYMEVLNTSPIRVSSCINRVKPFASSGPSRT